MKKLLQTLKQIYNENLTLFFILKRIFVLCLISITINYFIVPPKLIRHKIVYDSTTVDQKFYFAEKINNNYNNLAISRDSINIDYDETLDVQPDIISNNRGVKKNIKNRQYLTNNEWKYLSSSDRDEYVNQYIKTCWKICHDLYKKYGVHPMLILARGATESRYLTSELSVNENNHFGIKWSEATIDLNPNFFKKRSKKYHDDNPDDTFFVFEDEYASFEAFAIFVQKERYIKHLPHKNLKDNSLKEWSKALCSGNYSTHCPPMGDYKRGVRLYNRAKKMKLKQYSNYKL